MAQPDVLVDGHFLDDTVESTDELTFTKKLVFVMMHFADNTAHTYTIIKEECGKLGLKAFRGDDIHGSDIITQSVMKMIEEAEYIVCDLTDARQNVYYELGYAHGCGNWTYDILLIARKGTKVHSDISMYRINYYGSDDELRSIVSENFKGMMTFYKKKRKARNKQN